MTPPAGVFAHIAGEDLVQGQDGRWWVLEDNLRIPSGARVFVASRRVSARRMDVSRKVWHNAKVACATWMIVRAVEGARLEIV